jgi:hypothetical protein
MKNNTAINKKGQTVKLPSGCTPCDVLVSSDSYYLYNPGKTGNHFTGISKDLTNYNPNIPPGTLPPPGVNWPDFGKTVAMYGDKIYAVDKLSEGIYEWEIDYDLCEAKHINTYFLKPHSTLGTLAGACMKDANTLIAGSAYVQGSPYHIHSIFRINVGSPSSAGFVHHTILFNLPFGLQVMGDITYVASTSTILAFLKPIGGGTGRYIYHFDMSGNVLSFTNFSGPTVIGGPPSTAGVGSLFHYGGKEYLSEYTASGAIYEIKMNPVSYTLTNLVPAPPYTGDMASAPDTANPQYRRNFGCETSWECVQLGTQPAHGYKCVEIQGVVGTASGGQYATKQDCLKSGCEGINPDPGMPFGKIGCMDIKAINYDPTATYPCPNCCIMGTGTTLPAIPTKPLVGGTSGLSGTSTESNEDSQSVDEQSGTFSETEE